MEILNTIPGTNVATQANNTATATQPTYNDTLLKTITDKLMTSSDMISSSNTAFESTLQSALAANQQNLTNQNTVITNQYDRMIGIQSEKDKNAMTAVQEKGVGVNTSDIAYRAMAKEADQNIKDLEQRKSDAILQNNTAAAQQYSALQVELYKTKTQALKDTFNNLLSIGNYAREGKQLEMQSQQQDFNQRSAMANVALEYGVTMKPGDTLDTVIARAAPNANAKQLANLAKLKAETYKAKAEAQKAINDGKLGTAISDPGTLAAIGSQYRAINTNPDIRGKFKDNREQNAVINEAMRQEATDLKNFVPQLMKAGFTKDNVGTAAAEYAKHLEANNNVVVNQDNINAMLMEMLPEGKAQMAKPSWWQSIVDEGKKQYESTHTSTSSRQSGIPDGGLIGQFFK